MPPVLGGQAGNGRDAALLGACGGDVDQLDRVKALLDRRPAATQLHDIAPPRHAYNVELRSIDAVPPKKPNRVRISNVTTVKEAPAVLPQVLPAPSCCAGKRATWLALNVRDLEDNPGDFRCATCGRLLDSPQSNGNGG